jgi:hypothetical protein
MAKYRGTKKHVVNASMKVLELNNAGSSMSLDIFSDGSKLGQIVLGRGSFTWIGKGRHKGKRFNWTKFAEIMDRCAYGE